MHRTLSRDAQGLRYETSNKDDGFTAGLSNLERFEVDYLQKTLRVKLRGGKRVHTSPIPMAMPTGCSSFTATWTRRGSVWEG